MESPTNTTNLSQKKKTPPTTQHVTPPPETGVTSLHVTALDGIVNVNSLFTVAIFIGFSFTTPEDAHAGSRLGYTASRDIIRRLVVYEVVSFSFFLYSSLVAQTLKLTVNLINMMDLNDLHKAKIHQNALKYGMFGSAAGVFLVLSIVDFVQVKSGVYSCGGKSVYGIVTGGLCRVWAAGLCGYGGLPFVLCRSKK